MINNDWERFGDEIRRTIQNAVDSQDFSRLNQTVSDTIGKAMDSVSRGVKNGGWYRQKDDNMARGAAGVDMESVFGSGVRRNSSAQHAAPAKKLLYLKGTSTRIGGIFLAVTGYIFTAGALAFLLFLGLGAAVTGWSTALKAGMAVFGLFGLAFVAMGLAGTNMACSVGRFRKYVKGVP